MNDLAPIEIRIRADGEALIRGLADDGTLRRIFDGHPYAVTLIDERGRPRTLLGGEYAAEVTLAPSGSPSPRGI